MSNKPYPKISIITPSYNQGEFLEETIKSVLNQDYPNLEYIIIDGGSKDNSVDIIKRHEKYLAYWVSERDNGQTQAINKGLSKASGDILAYLNSDDVHLPNTLALVGTYFKKNLNTKFIYGNVKIINGKGNLIKNKKQPPFDYKMGCMIGFGLLIDQPSAFWRREVYEKIGPFNEDFQYNMDAEYWFRVLQKYQIIHLDKYLAKVRLHSRSITIMNKNETNERYHLEIELILKNSYNTLVMSKFVPYKYSKHLRKLYRIKRIFKRLGSGHYWVRNKI